MNYIRILEKVAILFYQYIYYPFIQKNVIDYLKLNLLYHFNKGM